jgi:hypothetical protein
VRTGGPAFGDWLSQGLMAGMSQRPPSMYWCVGPEGSAVCPEPTMEASNGKKAGQEQPCLLGGSGGDGRTRYLQP